MEQRLCSCTSVIYTVENPTNYVTTATLTAADDNLWRVNYGLLLSDKLLYNIIYMST